MKGKSDFVGIKVSIDQEKNIDQLKSFFLGGGNLKLIWATYNLFLDQSCVCIFF
jgi:hypothetical protein